MWPILVPTWKEEKILYTLIFPVFMSKQDVLDGRCEMYIVRGSVFDVLLRQSPFERHRRVIQECVRENGGYFEGFDIPQWMIDRCFKRLIPLKRKAKLKRFFFRILNGHAVGLASEDLMAGSRHLVFI